ncbi:MAG: Na+/H+ antiporter [Verrucomicrobiales bacterium]|nr:Na+/H+ antiporter [Verrucomicrobiales bacterium]
MANVVEVFVGLLLAVAALGLAARKLQVPYPVLLVVAGLLFGLIPGLPRVELSPEFVFLFFLPPLLFPAALFTSWRDFHANLRPILLLAIGLVLFTTVAVGWLAHYLIPGLPLAAGFVLGAIISPPDAIAATTIAERLSVPRRIVTILEGESLVNDATALVAYRFAVAAVLSNAFSLAEASSEFIMVSLGGILVGLAFGWIVAWFHRQVDDAPIEVTVSLLTPFAAYLAAERLRLSGVLAVVTAGLFLGWRTPEITNSRTRLQGGPFWEMVEFILNGFVFILIGLQLPEVLRALPDHSLGQLVWYAVVISLAVILIRIGWVFPATYLPRLLIRKIRERDPYPAWQHVTIVAWTGMRGVVSLAAALALPLTTETGARFPGRDLILFLTFSVILATLVIQGLSLPLLIGWLRIKDDKSAEKEERLARLKANQAALAQLTEMYGEEPTKQEPLQRLRIEYEDRVRQLEVCTPENGDEPRRLFGAEYEQLSQEALRIERKIILQLRNERVINDHVLRRIQRDIDLAEARLRGR